MPPLNSLQYWKCSVTGQCPCHRACLDPAVWGWKWTDYFTKTYSQHQNKVLYSSVFTSLAESNSSHKAKRRFSAGTPSSSFELTSTAKNVYGEHMVSVRSVCEIFKKPFQQQLSMVVKADEETTQESLHLFSNLPINLAGLKSANSEYEGLRVKVLSILVDVLLVAMDLEAPDEMFRSEVQLTASTNVWWERKSEYTTRRRRVCYCWISHSLEGAQCQRAGRRGLVM